MIVAVWTLIAVVIGVVVTTNVAARNERRGLRTEMQSVFGQLQTEIGGLRTELQTEVGGLRTEVGGLRTEVHVLAERQAQMNGRLDVVVAQAHTHPATTGS